MQRYIGTKIIEAEPEERDGRPGYKVVYNRGTRFAKLTSWSPADVFEDACRPMKSLTFGLAIEALRRDLRVSRRAWKGKGMWLILVRAESWSTSVGPSHVAGAHRLPWIGLKTVDGGLVPWTPSPTDMLAEDWEIVE